MRLLDKLERRLGRFAIPNITLGLIALQILTYALSLASPQFLMDLLLIPSKVMEGEFWRLFSFLATPPTTNPLFAFLFWYMLMMMGTALENHWGAFRYNLYLLVGYLATVAAAFTAATLFNVPDFPASNAFLQGTVFLAFAFLYPDFTIYVFFLFPVKIKWLALLAWAGYLYAVLFGDWLSRLLAISSVLNFFLFFGTDVLGRMRSGKRRMDTQARKIAQRNQPRHRCVVCGITDRSRPDMEFRYCSKCEGTHGYCRDHLYNHEHIVREVSNEA